MSQLAFFDLFIATLPGWEFPGLPESIARFWAFQTPKAPASVVRAWLAEPVIATQDDRYYAAALYAISHCMTSILDVLDRVANYSHLSMEDHRALLTAYASPSLHGEAAKHAVLVAALEQWPVHWGYTPLVSYLPDGTGPLLTALLNRGRRPDLRKTLQLWAANPNTYSRQQRAAACARVCGGSTAPKDTGPADLAELSRAPSTILHAYLFPHIQETAP